MCEWVNKLIWTHFLLFKVWKYYENWGFSRLRDGCRMFPYRFLNSYIGQKIHFYKAPQTFLTYARYHSDLKWTLILRSIKLIIICVKLKKTILINLFCLHLLQQHYVVFLSSTTTLEKLLQQGSSMNTIMKREGFWGYGYWQSRNGASMRFVHLTNIWELVLRFIFHSFWCLFRNV